MQGALLLCMQVKLPAVSIWSAFLTRYTLILRFTKSQGSTGGGARRAATWVQAMHPTHLLKGVQPGGCTLSSLVLPPRHEIGQARR